jgi:hypothetical protein
VSIGRDQVQFMWGTVQSGRFAWPMDRCPAARAQPTSIKRANTYAPSAPALAPLNRMTAR